MTTSSNNKIVNLPTLNVESIQDWNQMVPVIKEVFRAMAGDEDFAFHHEVVMDGLMSLDLSATKEAVTAFLKDFCDNEIS